MKIRSSSESNVDNTVPGPDAFEERRQTAEVVADIHHTLSRVVERAPELLPGEAVDEVKDAWPAHSEAFSKLVDTLAPFDPRLFAQLRTAYQERERQQIDVPPGQSPANPSPFVAPPGTIDLDLDSAGLTGKAGRAKRWTLGWLRDRFYRFFNSAPFKRLTQAKCVQALAEYANFASSFVGSIPVAAQVKEKVIECIELFRLH